MSVAAMVFGILGLVTCWVPFLGAILAFIGLFLGIIAMIKKSGNKAFGLIGIVVGGIALIIGVVWTIVFGVLADAGMDAYDQYRQDGTTPFSQPQ